MNTTISALHPVEAAKPISGALARLLEQNRTRYNARVGQTKKHFPRLDDAKVAAVLRELVQPLVELVDQYAADKTGSVTDVYFDLALELCGRGILGDSTRYPFIEFAWQTLLPSLTPLIVTAPRTIIGSITNAVYTLSCEPSANPMYWLTRLRQAAPLLSDVSTLLKMGQVTAWQTGMAHYRQPALTLCQSLSPALLKIAFGMSTQQLTMEQIVAIMAANPWYQPAVPDAYPQLRIVKCAGAFRGFGGVFMAPPTVYASGDTFVASDGTSTWLLHADAFGATFHRTQGMPRAESTASAFGFKVITGKVSKNQFTVDFPELETVSSIAANATTLAVTTPWSHTISLISVC